MAETRQFVFSLIFSLYIQIVLSRVQENFITTNAVFDVSSSIQQTLDVLSFERKHDALRSSSNSSNSLSISLYPRSALEKSHHKDYESLTISRLTRDSARAKSIAAKLETIVEPEDLQTPITSGASLGSGEYFARVSIGQPAKSFYMVIDTGSDITWLQCQPCLECYQQYDPLFVPSSSSTYNPLSCGSNQCNSLKVSACRNSNCYYQVAYGDGSYTVGEFATETISFGSSGTVENVAIGCGHDNEGLFIGAAGLIGLGGGPLSLTSQIKATSFSYCLVNRDSTSASTLEFNSATPGDSVTAPLLRNAKMNTFFYIGVVGMSVGGQKLSIPPAVFSVDGTGRGGIIVDSGTAVTRLQTQAYNALRDAFVGMTKNLPPATSGFSLFDTCYDLSSVKRISIPVVAFHFAGGKRWALGPNNYLIPVNSAGKYCLAFAPTAGSLSIIGNIQQQGTRVSYDLANSVVGFSPDKC